MTHVSPAGRLPTLFIPHGGGPCFFMDTRPPLPAELWDAMGDYLRGIDAAIGVRPKAVLVVSGHWETQVPTVNTGAHPPLLFDYYGFPEHTYRLTYPAPGAPDLAQEVRRLLEAAGFLTAQDTTRGFDHGVFVPLKLVYPDADIPVLQLSLRQDLDPQAHLDMGRALEPLRDQGVLIIGSGMSFHNLRTLMAGGGRGDAEAQAFDDWLTDAVQADPATRDVELSLWDQAPGARSAHPRAEHILPLMVAAGAAGEDKGVRTYSDKLMGKAVSGFRFG